MDPQPARNAPQGKKRKDPPHPSTGAMKSAMSSTKGRPQKRTRFADARKIDAQPQDAALKAGELDLQSFLDARDFEIRALESAMQKSTASKSRRAFQSVPRELRRRTASHNAGRVPKRLRARAKREMVADNTPTVTQKRRPRSTRARLRAETAKQLDLLIKRKKQQLKKAAEAKGDTFDPDKPVAITSRKPKPKIRRNALNEPPVPKPRFRKRQKDKTWLPTHVWHAKRARMSEPKKPLWGFAVPITPSQKSYRPTHRAIYQSGGAIAWDTSYMSTIGVYGSQIAVEETIKEACRFEHGEWEAKGDLYTKGCQPAYPWLHHKATNQEIAPVTIFFNPKPPPPKRKSRRPKVDELREFARREVFIRVHPSAFNEAWDLLRRLAKMRASVHIEDLRYEIGSIETMGSCATEVLKATLHPYWTLKRDREPDVDVYRDIDTYLGPENYPGCPMFGFAIVDPRLRFPQKKIADNLAPYDVFDRNRQMIKWLKTSPEHPYELFDNDSRQAAIDNFPSQRSINKRCGNSAPGKFPDLKGGDPPIPIILYIQRKPARWILLAPFKLIDSIWHCLVKCPLSTGGDLRFGGIQEQQQAAFEENLGWFPGDFPETKAGQAWELSERTIRAQLWQRRPKSKRVEWKSLDLGLGRRGELGNGHACDWEYLFKPTPDDPPTADDGHPDEPMASTEDVPAQATPAQRPQPNSPLNMVRFNRLEWEDLLTNTRKGILTEVPAQAIIQVRITFLGSGKVSRGARIYRLPSRNQPDPPEPSTQPAATDATGPSNPRKPLPADLREQWLAQSPSHKPPGATAGDEDEAPAPSSSSPKTAKNRRRKKRGGGGAAGPSSAAATDPDEDSTSSEARQRRIAEMLFATAPPTAGADGTADPRATSLNGHPFVPDEGDLIGFVTSGAFNLRMGKPSAIGAVSLVKVKEDLVAHEKLKEVTTCVVRDAGERIGWLAWWEVI